MGKEHKNGCLGCFQFSEIMSKTTINVCVQVCVHMHI